MKIKFEKKSTKPSKMSIFISSLISVLIALIFLGFIILSLGDDPFEAYWQLVSWAMGTVPGLIQSLVSMMPLLFTSLGVLIAFKMKLWNIGAEGQFQMGAFAATWGALYLFPNIHNPWVMIPLLMILGAAFGAFWGFLPGIMRAYLGVNEILSTLMLNYVAIYWVNYLTYGPWKGAGSYNFPITAKFPQSAILPQYGSGGLNFGIIISIIMAFFVLYLVKYTKFGFHLEIAGDNLRAGEYAGINVKKLIILAMVIGGAISGIGGMAEMSGVLFRLQPNFSPGYGYTAVIIAWLARLDPIATIVVSFFFGALLVGSQQLQLFMQIPSSLINAFNGILLFSLLASEVFMRYRIRVVRS
ncbi:MAG: ABC transporter permease [Mesoaciditoga sp.]|uniref:ABC transporter permease n=1 Tax=Athalassotoga sp. TaxID=2022597 RepID=UPI000CAF7562|nr:MAG: ABC transporter permease [Mesoaciditoga sp.]HEU25174.1 ABC transporter permease [Mesoaciditoga lauensis]